MPPPAAVAVTVKPAAAQLFPAGTGAPVAGVVGEAPTAALVGATVAVAVCAGAVDGLAGTVSPGAGDSCGDPVAAGAPLAKVRGRWSDPPNSRTAPPASSANTATAAPARSAFIRTDTCTSLRRADPVAPARLEYGRRCPARPHRIDNCCPVRTVPATHQWRCAPGAPPLVDVVGRTGPVGGCATGPTLRPSRRSRRRR